MKKIYLLVIAFTVTMLSVTPLLVLAYSAHEISADELDDANPVMEIELVDQGIADEKKEEDDEKRGISNPTTRATDTAGTNQQLRNAISSASPGVPTTIYITNDFQIGNTIEISDGRDIILKSNNTTVRTLTSSTSFLPNFRVLASSSLTLESGILIDGHSRSGGVSVGRDRETHSEATFIMNGGTITNIRGTSSTLSDPSPVSVHSGGTFIMNGGEISHNETTNSFGGGVGLRSNMASFVMTGGTISHNTASTFGGGIGGLGTVSITNGTISQNTAGTYGGGIGLTSLSSTRLSVGSQVTFSGNSASSVREVPFNVETALPNIQSRSSSIPTVNHPLNNFDIGFQTASNPSLFTLTVARNLAEGGDVVIAGQTNINSLSLFAGTIPIEARAFDGYRFVGWETNHVSTRVADQNARVTTVTVGANSRLTARFERITHHLNLEANPTTGGSPEAGGTTVAQGDVTTLRANPAPGYRFVSWEVLSGTGSQIADEKSEETTFTMGTSDTTVIAEYERIPYTLTLEASPAEGGSPSTNQTILNVGDKANIIAKPNPGYRFVRWSIVGESNSQIADEESEETVLTMGTADTTVRAEYERSGTLKFLNVPAQLKFRNTTIQSQMTTIQRADLDWFLTIEDTRLEGAPWSLMVSAEPLKSLDGQHEIEGAVIFKKDDRTYFLNEGSAPVHAEATVGSGERKIHWDPDEGLLLQLNLIEARVTTYTTKVSWTLSSVYPNE